MKPLLAMLLLFISAKGMAQVDHEENHRVIEMGETVIYDGKLWLTSTPVRDNYDLMPVDGKKKDIVKNINRRWLAVTRGCFRNICTKSSVISKHSKSYVAVEGITYNDRYILKNVATGELTAGVEFRYLVKTEGCLNNGFEEVCVGDTVSDRKYQSVEVVGIQSEGLVVIKDHLQRMFFNIDPRGLGVIRN